MSAFLCSRTAWQSHVVLVVGSLVICGCGSSQQTASLQDGTSSSPRPPVPPAMQAASPQFNQAPDALTPGTPSSGTSSSLNRAVPGASGSMGQPGVTPVPSLGNVSAVDSQSRTDAPDDVAPGALAVDTTPSGPPVEGYDIGNIAPEIDGEDLNGEVFRLSEYRGQVVMLDFWGDW